MSHKTPMAGSVEDWIEHAQSDLLIAKTRRSARIKNEHLCFHAQQAAEKSLKAVLVHHGVGFEKTHDLAHLLAKLPDSLSVPPALLQLPLLNKYAVQYRYPGETPTVDAKQRKRAISIAEECTSWAKRVTSRRLT